MKHVQFSFALLSLAVFSSVYAASPQVSIALTNETKTSIGSIDFEDSPYGLMIKPHLSNLPAGIHGFHIHEHPSCDDNGMSAGGHFDPHATHSHQGPYGAGHLGDLPALAVNNHGEATIPLLAPRLKTKDLKGHALMIHEGGDNYSDNPPMGGGGARIACGVFSSK